MPVQNPLPREDGTADAAARILDAADTLFCERGYDGVSVRDVAEKAAVNKASVFYYFSSKGELFEQVVNRLYKQQRNAMREAYEQQGPVIDRIHRLMDAYFDFFESHSRFAKLMNGLAQNPAHAPMIADEWRPFLRWTESMLTRVVKPAGPTAARQIVLTVSGAMQNFFVYDNVLELLFEGDIDADALIKERRAHMHWLVDALLAQLEAELEA